MDKFFPGVVYDVPVVFESEGSREVKVLLQSGRAGRSALDLRGKRSEIMIKKYAQESASARCSGARATGAASLGKPGMPP
jgi:hypothetical protein